MKKSILIITSIAAVVLLSGFMIAHNVTNDMVNNIETIYVSGEWEYYKPVTVYYDGGYKHSEQHIWKKTVCGDPDYLISWGERSLVHPQSISKNYRYGKEQDWTTEYKYTANLSGGESGTKCYFSTYLQGWD